MRITLIQPQQGASFGFSRILMIEPLGLEQVGGALLEGGHDVHLMDLRLDGDLELQADLESHRPAAVGISCGFTTDVYSTLILARKIRDRFPEMFLFVGGHHTSLVPGDLLFPGSPVDAVVIGEGEQSAAALIDAVARGDDPGSVAGVMTLDNRRSGFVPRPTVQDLDDLPLPARHLTVRYRSRYHHGFSAPSAAVETSRGCPFNCNFCSVWKFYDRTARQRSPARIVEDLEQVRALGGKRVFVTDDIAFLQRDIYRELGERIRKADLGLTFACETRSDLVVKYRELFPLWRAIGTDTVFLGVEKFDDDGLGSLRKRTRGGTDTNLEAIEILRRSKIIPMTSLITDPDWGEDDFDRLERTVLELRLPNPSFTILTPLPGTELWETRKTDVTTSDYSFYDVIHLILPSRLGPERFYERFARLYKLTPFRDRISGGALATFFGLLVNNPGAVRRVLGAARDLGNPRGYLEYPGANRCPDFLPEGYGTVDWIDDARSYLAPADGVEAEKQTVIA